MPTTMSLIDEALDLIKEAKDLEESRGINQQRQEHSPSWVVLEESAKKYHEACYLMKRHIKIGSLKNDKKKLLIGFIGQYEPHADGLQKEANDLKLADQQQQQERQRRSISGPRSIMPGASHGRKNGENPGRNNSNGHISQTLERGSSNSLWEAEHKSQLHHPTTTIGEPTAENNGGRNSYSPISELERKATEAAGKAGHLLAAAEANDAAGELSEAKELYCQAAQSYLTAVDFLSPKNGGISTSHKRLVSSLKQKTGVILSRVEELKNAEANSSAEPSAPPIVEPSAPPLSPPPAPVDEPSAPMRAHINLTPQHHRPDRNANQPDKLTPYEVKVLSWSSRIASGLFLPWSEEEARAFNYNPSIPYTDPDGVLELSDKQKDKFCKWARPVEIATMRRKRSPCNIAMVKSITPYTIKQHCVSDCSFIAGLCISAAYERRFNKRLVSSIIYPQDPKTGMPVYNPKGIYMVKLWLNGVARRVLIDDFFPVDDRGSLLCSHTTSIGKSNGSVLELWVPILEKAYMKLCGGYDFPGSNSGVDLFSLTGWIPERLFFPQDPNNVKDFEIPVERAWERLNSASSWGDCLVTVSTSKELTEEQAEQVGLFTGHAYAVLGVVQTSNGTRLLQLKNPWASKGWKGRFSSRDKDGWRDPNFCKEVGYDASSAVQFDDGVFWMSWDDVLLYFRNIHMSWSTDPQLFRCRTSVHGYWSKETGPNDDSYNVGDNPQYTVTLSEKAIESKAKLWILLSRHVTKQEQEGAEVTDYLTQHIHRIKHPKERVHYPNANSVLTGAYTNNQHVLVKYDAKGPEDKFLNIVLSQYKKSNDLGYTLSCFCTEEFQLGYPGNPLPKSQQLVGSWKLRDSATDNSYSLAIGTAGGPPGKGSFGSNPQWSIRVPVGGISIQVKCMAHKELPINIILARCIYGSGSQLCGQNDQKSKRINHLHEDPIIDTGLYRHGFAVSEVVFVSAGLYVLVASTFEAGQVGPFLLHVLSSKEVHISEIDKK